jgi:DNA-binding XRE family transcriptional regulator
MPPLTLKERRTRIGYTQQQVAQMLGVSQQTVARWEGGGDIPSKYLKDLAVILVCRVSDLVGESAEGRGGSSTLRLMNRLGENPVDEDDDQVLYGTARVAFMPRLDGPVVPQRPAEPQDNEYEYVPDPNVHEYPISEREMKRLFSRFQNEDERSTWFTFETLDNRLVLVNRSELEAFEMIGDDVTQAPPAEHEEVYAALSDWDMRELIESGVLPNDDDASAKYSRKFVEACAAVVEEWGGMDATRDRVSGITIETVRGRRENLFSDPEEEAYQSLNSLAFSIDLGWDKENAPVSEQLIQLGTEGYYRSSYYRLGALRLIEAPLYVYTQAIRAEWDEGNEEEEPGDGNGKAPREA